MTTSYYDRTAATHLDGSPIFKTALDERNETEVSALLSKAWRCELHSFGRLSPIDWYAVRDERMVAVLELKSRTDPSTKYPTALLNVRKWLALRLAAVGLGVPAIFVVRYTDAIYWIDTAIVDAEGHKMGGCLRLVKSRSDVEPVILVQLAAMTQLA